MFTIIVQCVGTEIYQFILISIRSGSTKIRLSQYQPSVMHLSCGAPDFPARRDFPIIFSKYQDECLAKKVMLCFVSQLLTVWERKHFVVVIVDIL